MSNVVMAVDTLTNVKLIGADVKDILINTVVPILGIWFVARTWKESGSPLKTFVALIAAGAIWWGVLNMTLLRDQTGETWNHNGTKAAALVTAPVATGGEGR
ncbi:hypothetical protein [Streptomyces roseochromogenus]|uniref:Uncharacterized protein n=1 Tax=Streptomyces roseochromogenus subsp. oscitans DS 12.976 TaxID=1352936 RepID=V6JEC3_STRRC|nr:hypothetical protein [Streptomyces roseochromogenus]EST18078.1 hypothetical protein M878_45785 [Streptomyces roseochromogenus subsp. oscitans DS 12.976]